MPGRRRASIVLPEPGGPTMSRLWPPAAAISRARRASAWPRTSERSGPSAAARARRSPMGGGVVRASSVPSAMASASVRLAAPATPGTSAASGALAFGSTRLRTPSSRAARAAAIAPRTGRNAPSSASSPRNRNGRSAAAGSRPEAASTPMASGRSRREPSLRRSPGARLAVMRWFGQACLELTTAARTRCRDSRTPALGRPTIWKSGRCRSRATSTSTGRASIPMSAIEDTFANMSRE